MKSIQSNLPLHRDEHRREALLLAALLVVFLALVLWAAFSGTPPLPEGMPLDPNLAA